MWNNDKNYLITWTDSTFENTFKVVFKGDKVRAALREINFIDTTHVLEVKELD